MSILDEVYDGPEYGGPIVTLPPDDVVGPMEEYVDPLTVPNAWHRFDWIKERLWPVATGKDINVAVLDTGYSKHAYGPEPIAARSFISGEDSRDPVSNHGTHVAGTVLCRRDSNGNSIGLAPDANLTVGKVLSNRGSGGSNGIAAGIRWAADAGAHVINMSLGGGSSHAGTNEAIDYAWSKGCIVVAAAGNSGFNNANTIGWPAKYEGCLCIGAYQQNGTIANFSSGGREIDAACPGQGIISFSNNGSGFRSMSGTSMATPYCAGLLACLTELWLRQGRPMFRSAQEVRNYFRQALIDAGAPGFDFRFGWGIPSENFLVEAILKDLVPGA